MATDDHSHGNVNRSRSDDAARGQDSMARRQMVQSVYRPGTRDQL